MNPLCFIPFSAEPPDMHKNAPVPVRAADPFPIFFRSRESAFPLLIGLGIAEDFPYGGENATRYIHGVNHNLGLSPADAREKNALMRKSPLRYYRATPGLFFRDIFFAYRNGSQLLPAPPRIPINGDLHIGNFGVVKDADGTPCWGINDFDQSSEGSPEWDLERFAVSLVLQADFMEKQQQAELVKYFARSYCTAVRQISESQRKPSQKIPYLYAESSEGAVKKLLEKAAKKTQEDLLKKYTCSEKGDPEFLTGGELYAVGAPVEEEILKALKKSETASGLTEILDIAEKKGGGGSSYGLTRYWILAKPAHEKPPVILEMKKLTVPAAEDQNFNTKSADGRKIFERQAALGGVQNPFTGYTEIGGEAYLIREREAVKDDLNLKKADTPGALAEIAGACALVLAKAHCYEKDNAQAVAAWIGNGQITLADRLAAFALQYAAQTKTNYEEFRTVQ